MTAFQALLPGPTDLTLYNEALAQLDLRLNVTDTPFCYRGRVPYLGMGYLEGIGTFLSIGSFGAEVVYDFAAMERLSFEYNGVIVNPEGVFLGGASLYMGGAYGFRSNVSIADDYSGPFAVGSLGVGIGPLIVNRTGIGAGGGVIGFGTPVEGEGQIIGMAVYLSGSIGFEIGIAPLIEGAGGRLWYSPMAGVKTTYYAGNKEGGTKTHSRVDRNRLIFDIIRGAGSPWSYLSPGVMMPPFNLLYTEAKLGNRIVMIRGALHWAEIHDEIYIESFNTP
jgi:hypothetical protein